MQNDTIIINNSSIWFSEREPFDTKDIMIVVFPANLLANVLTNEVAQHRKIDNSINLNNKHDKHNKLTLV